MNPIMLVSVRTPGPDQQIGLELKGEGLHPANRAQRDGETRAGRVRIEPDQQAILALERVSGAHVHQATGLIQAYINACYLGEVEMAEAVKRDMAALAVRCIRESLATRRPST